MKPVHPVVISNLREITGLVRPMALANAIHVCFPSSWGGAFFITLDNIRDCIEAGDRWFEEETPEGFRVSTDSGFSCIVRDRLALCAVPSAAIECAIASKDEPQVERAIAPKGAGARMPPSSGGRETMLDTLRRAEQFMSGFEDDPTQEGIDDDLDAIRLAIARLEDGAVADSFAREHFGTEQQ